MPLSQTEFLWSGATPLLLISPARFFLYKGPKIDYFLRPPLDYRLLFALVSLPARLPAQSPAAGGGGCARHTLPARRGVQSPSVGCPHGCRPCWRWASMFCRGNPADAASMRSDAAACTQAVVGKTGGSFLLLAAF